MIKQKVITIIGTTASGKTGLAVRLACKYGGEVVSADSRQVYRGMDIGTGKDLGEYEVRSKKLEVGNQEGEMGVNYESGIMNYGGKNKNLKLKIENYNVPYHLIDVVNPMDDFSLANWQRLAWGAIDDIGARKRLPIVAGGTGMYTQAIVDGYNLSAVGPNKETRVDLEKLGVEGLFEILHGFNPDFAENLNNSDRHNPRRLIRYIEMARLSGDDLKIDLRDKKIGDRYDFLVIGLNWPREVLHNRIHKRLIERLEKENMIGEVERLHQEGVTWERLYSFGLEYRYIAKYLQGQMDYDEMVEELHRAIKKFAKRQMSWYRRWEKQGQKIYWFEGDGSGVDEVVNNFLRK